MFHYCPVCLCFPHTICVTVSQVWQGYMKSRFLPEHKMSYSLNLIPRKLKSFLNDPRNMSNAWQQRFGAVQQANQLVCTKSPSLPWMYTPLITQSHPDVLLSVFTEQWFFGFQLLFGLNVSALCLNNVWTEKDFFSTLILQVPAEGLFYPSLLAPEEYSALMRPW